jgi:hypothetical protein
MALTDTQLTNMSKRMNIPLAGVFFKDELPKKLETNKVYFINMEDSIDEDGNENDGSHWVMAEIRQHDKGNMEPIFFDPYGQPAPEIVKKRICDTANVKGVPYTEKDIQSLMNNACGFYCLAMAHYINASKYRTTDFYTDVSDFMEMFDDLNKSVDFKKNEFVLKHFFRSQDPEKRNTIDVYKPIDSISTEDMGGGFDGFKGERIECDVKILK